MLIESLVEGVMDNGSIPTWGFLIGLIAMASAVIGAVWQRGRAEGHTTAAAASTVADLVVLSDELKTLDGAHEKLAERVQSLEHHNDLEAAREAGAKEALKKVRAASESQATMTRKEVP